MNKFYFNWGGLAVMCICVLSACGGGGSDGPSVASTSTPITTVSAKSDQNISSALEQDLGQDSKTDSEQNSLDSEKPAASIGMEAPYQVIINGHTHRDKSQIVLNDFKENAFSEIPTQSGSIRAYRQQYSIIAGYLAPQSIVGQDDEGKNITIREEPMGIGLVKGDITATLPDVGQYQYTGQAFSEDETGRFNYKVDFNQRKGSGEVTGIEKTGTITLQEADIKNVVYNNTLDGSHMIAKGIEGKTLSEAQVNGDYSLTFFGPEAKEIGGIVYQPSMQIGVGGTAQ
ncbi:factor H binding family protein [Neisseria montereyensis]|uniref:Factor H binding family protein n=1 Tax=Neisseria montereyensis TaxID=2973938 RepID=A0ABT2FDD6_9NEIS|nr:factor H binding family protein [Neisseria montereyensis]MCS4534222.1 factor H binding family protein [Neisseria montereyensis]